MAVINFTVSRHYLNCRCRIMVDCERRDFAITVTRGGRIVEIRDKGRFNAPQWDDVYTTEKADTLAGKLAREACTAKPQRPDSV
jgi:uncharacterized protein (DUF488 family)